MEQWQRKLILEAQVLEINDEVRILATHTVKKS
jgi:hypothetical protein